MAQAITFFLDAEQGQLWHIYLGPTAMCEVQPKLDKQYAVFNIGVVNFCLEKVSDVLLINFLETYPEFRQRFAEHADIYFADKKAERKIINF